MRNALQWVRSLFFVAQMYVMMLIAAIVFLIPMVLHPKGALVANQQVIAVLRLIGARDDYIVRAFVRRYTIRSFIGACAGVGCAVAVLYFFPDQSDTAGIFAGLRLSGIEWLRVLWMPFVAGLVAYVATRRSAFGALRELP